MAPLRLKPAIARSKSKPSTIAFYKHPGLNVGPSLHVDPYFVYVSSEGSGGSVHMHRPTRASLLTGALKSAYFFFIE